MLSYLLQLWTVAAVCTSVLWMRQLTSIVHEATDMRYALLERPKVAVPRFCRRRAQESGAKLGNLSLPRCQLRVLWHSSSDQWSDVCTGRASFPRRYYHFTVDCRAVLFSKTYAWKHTLWQIFR